MKVAHFNTFLHGGAAIAAIRIHEGLRHFRRTVVSSELYHHQPITFGNPSCDPHDSQSTDRHPVQFKPSKPSRFRAPLAYRKFKQRQAAIFHMFDSHLAERDRSAESFSMAELPQATALDWRMLNADLIHLHWVAHLMDFPSFFASIPAQIPIVWTLHDMNPFTGGCHYSDGCVRYRFGCGECPQIKNPTPNDVSRSTIDAKRKSLHDRRIAVVAPCQWMCDQAKLSPVWPAATEFHVIKYGLDLHQFSPMCKHQARRELGMSTNAVLLGFGAADLRTPRKGIQHLLQALRILADNSSTNLPAAGLEVVVFGHGQLDELSGLPPIRHIGSLDSIDMQRRVYAAMDLVVVPSREDNQPQVGLEAMACGTPVVGFDVGGIPEYVRHEQTGLLAAAGNEADLAGQIRRLVEDRHLQTTLGQNARQMIETEFEITKQSAQYIQLYQRLTSTTAHAALQAA